MLALNSVYFFLLVISGLELRQYRTSRSVLTAGGAHNAPRPEPGVSILVPAFNEAAGIVSSIKATLSHNYPNYEIIVVNDGSTDETLPLLQEEFRLNRAEYLPTGDMSTQPIRAVYRASRPIPLVVVDKESGGKADALNAGLNFARKEIVAVVDADSLLDADALHRAVEPFEEDENCAAVGGTVRVVNGCEVRDGQVTRVRLPSSLLAQFQVIEYLRGFIVGRMAFCRVGMLLVISGAFGLFRRSRLVDVGGFLTTTVGEDMELVVKLHRFHLSRGLNYSVRFVQDAICWTEVPETLGSLRRQRNRWQRGAVEVLREHRAMFANRRFGRIGLVGLPFFLVFETLGPVVEISGYALTLAAFSLGLLSPALALGLVGGSLLLGLGISWGALVLHWFGPRRYRSIGAALALALVAVGENFGFRQLVGLWRVGGLVDGIRKKEGWGKMRRHGFGDTRRSSSSVVSNGHR